MRLEQRLRQEARTDFETATAQAANWQQAEHAAQALEEAARLAARAYSLGEGGLDQVLLNRRLALGSFAGAAGAIGRAGGGCPAETGCTSAMAAGVMRMTHAHP